MTYNMTDLAASDTFYKIVNFANDSSGGILVGLFMLSFFFIMLMVLKRYDFDGALLVSSWICFIISMLLTYAGLLNLVFTLLFLVIAAFTAFYMTVLKK